VLGGVAGGVVSIVRDAPDPTSSTQAFLPPEMAGMSSAMRVGIPVVVSTLAAATVLIVRRADQLGTSLDGAAVRGAVGALLLTIVVGYWVRRRDYWRRKFRQFMSEGKDYKPQRSTTA
jgi:type III secretory pathway component EscT